jgi:nucleotide-binding universal stress UspA family protein
VGPIVAVGFGGINGWYALSWASDFVGRTGGTLVLCHAYVPAASASDGACFPPGSARDTAVAQGVTATRNRLGAEHVRLRLEPVPVVELLLDAASTADLVVVGPPEARPRPRHPSTVHEVAGRAHGPVVVARRGDGRDHGAFAGHVVVGVDGHSQAALEFAFVKASRFGTSLAAVHVTGDRRQDYWFDEDVRTTHCTAPRAAIELLAREVEPWELKYPDVAVKRAVFGGSPPAGLIRASRGAALLVVGRSRRTAASALHGSVVSRAIESADAPVAVVALAEGRRGG